MKITVYSDESGVFDVVHNRYYEYGGLILLSSKERENLQRKYLSIEKLVKQSEGLSNDQEAKASVLTNANKARLFRLLNHTELFGGVVEQGRVLERIFLDKKSKQRYLDYVYKISLKRKFQAMIRTGRLDPNDVTSLQIYVDEHATATNGHYELREALENEFKRGTYNSIWTKYFPPIFPKIQQVSLRLCDSKANTLIRAADIVANHIYNDFEFDLIRPDKPNLQIFYFP